jgi:membrane-associated phospholipid phosphatase
MTSTRAKALVWAAALAIPPIVAVSRMYRGMHHPLDTLAGVLMGIAALTLALLLVHTTRVVARKREARGA